MCQDGPFSIPCDEGNNSGDKKLAILVCMWDAGQGEPVTRCLDMSICNIIILRICLSNHWLRKAIVQCCIGRCTNDKVKHCSFQSETKESRCLVLDVFATFQISAFSWCKDC